MHSGARPVKRSRARAMPAIRPRLSSRAALPHVRRTVRDQDGGRATCTCARSTGTPSGGFECPAVHGGVVDAERQPCRREGAPQRLPLASPGRVPRVRDGKDIQVRRPWDTCSPALAGRPRSSAPRSRHEPPSWTAPSCDSTKQGVWVHALGLPGPHVFRPAYWHLEWIQGGLFTGGQNFQPLEEH